MKKIFYQHPAVALAAVIGQPDARVDEVPLAYVQLKPGASATPAELHEWVRARTPERAAIPVQVIIIDAIPLTGVGKVFKPQLRWMAAQTVFAALLAPLAVEGVAVAVKVGADGTHGTLATVTLSATGGGALSAAEHARVKAKVAELLGPFTIRHVVT